MTQTSEAIKEKTINLDHIKCKSKNFYMTNPIINMIKGKLCVCGCVCVGDVCNSCGKLLIFLIYKELLQFNGKINKNCLSSQERRFKWPVNTKRFNNDYRNSSRNSTEIFSCTRLESIGKVFDVIQCYCAVMKWASLMGGI